MEIVGLWEVGTDLTASTSSVKWRRKVNFEFARDNQKISFPSPPSAGNGMDEIHTNVDGTGH
jgi:hypothetical protein